MGRLVGVDVGVLDDRLVDAATVAFREEGRLEQLGGETATVEEEVQVACALDAQLAHPRGQAPAARELLGDLPGLALEGACEVERRRQRQVAEAPARRNLDHGVVVDAEALADLPGEARGELLLERAEHGRRSLPQASAPDRSPDMISGHGAGVETGRPSRLGE